MTDVNGATPGPPRAEHTSAGVMLSAGELIGVAARLRQIQDELSNEGRLWIARNDLATVAARIEQEAGARAVQELRTQSMGNAA